MPCTFRLGDAWLNEYFRNRRLVKVFIQPNVSYGSLGKSVMPTTFRLGDTWLHENQLNHHKGEVFGLNLCNQGMNFSSPDKYLIVYPTAPKWVPIWGPGSPWGPFWGFGSPFYVLGPLFFNFRLKNLGKMCHICIFFRNYSK